MGGGTPSCYKAFAIAQRQRMEQQKEECLPTHPGPWMVQSERGRCSLGFHHELFQCLFPLIPTKQKNFFDFILLETHIVKLS